MNDEDASKTIRFFIFLIIIFSLAVVIINWEEHMTENNPVEIQIKEHVCVNELNGIFYEAKNPLADRCKINYELFYIEYSEEKGVYLRNIN